MGLVLANEIPASLETIAVQVNGAEIAVPKTTPDPLTGTPLPTTMIQACSLAGVDVPHYCYHPKLPVAGNCRMCLVEFGTPTLGPDRQPALNPDGTVKITKSPRPAIACATGLSPGMAIWTDTPAVKEMRRSVLEFLLVNHPLDCPICDQAGECKLQEYSVEYGQAASRFVEEKVHKPKEVDLGPKIVLDDERCILCSRCIRFTKDVVGDDALGFINRGSYSSLTHYPGKPFDNNYALNTVDICPVGALTSRDFRFRMRVWFLKETKSVCTSCATGCNIVISSRNDRVYRYEPRQNDWVNSTWMCDYGRLNYQWINHVDRLRQPTRSGQASTRESIAWQKAVDEIAARLSTAPKGSTALIISARQTNEELFLLTKLATFLGAMTDSIPRHGAGDHLLLHPDRNPNMAGARAIGIAADPPGSRLTRIQEGITSGTIETLIVFGEDVLKHGFAGEMLAKLRLLIASDILPNGTTALAHYVLPGCAHVEKRGTFTNAKGRVQRFLKAIEPPGEARPETDLLEALLRPLGVPIAHHSMEGLFDGMCREVQAFHGLTWGGLPDLGAPAKIS